MLILPPAIDFTAISPGPDPQWQQRSPGDPAGKASDVKWWRGAWVRGAEVLPGGDSEQEFNIGKCSESLLRDLPSLYCLQTDL